ncbi:YncE family protein [Gordonia sp. MP11Mi]|uniref:Lipoprotein n=1 Tax=Gordonia sp. MP11Mi TaxID=3022769 RepID=A0AA97CYH4_9ACTN
MRVRTRWTAGLLAAAVTLTLTACGSDSDDGDSSSLDTLPVATAAKSPTDTAKPVGAVVAQGAATAIAVAGSTTAVLGADGRTVTLHRAAGSADAPPPTRVALPIDGVVDLVAVDDHFLAVGPRGLVHIDGDGRTSVADVPVDSPLSLAVDGDKVLVGTQKGKLFVLSASGERIDEFGGFARVDDILVAPKSATEVEGQVSVLDRAQSAILPIDIGNGDRKASLRAGNGATNAVVDRFGRILVTGTRDDEFYAFFGEPIVMRMRHPAPASPFALAYDEKRDLLWVSSTAENEAVAYDLSRGDARERGRVPTVGQVTAMTVDSTSGNLLIASGRGDGLQAVPPDAIAP